MKTLRAYLEGNKFIRIPLKKVNSNHFKIKVKINNISGHFILDTGASNSCIDRQAAERFQLDVVESEIKASGAGATGMETGTATVKTVSIGLWETGKSLFVVFDMFHVNEALNQAGIEAVDGIIGADMLKKGRAVIDYGRNCVYLK